jgi:hypothetical protein
MALSFLPDSDLTLDVVVTCDPAVVATEEQAQAYLVSGDMNELGGYEGATIFTLKALSPSDRETAEVKAGAYTRSELGRMLWVDAPDEPKTKARWHHELAEDEREALALYQAYLNNVFMEMVNVALIKIDGEEATGKIDLIKPESHRLTVISELVQHIQRMSLLGRAGK